MADKKHDIDQLIEKKIASIIENEIASFDGISRLSSGSLTSNIADTVLRRDSPVHGIRIEKDDEEYLINIKIIVFYGVNIPQLSYDIQTKLKNAFNSENISIKSINISVEGIEKAGANNE